MAVSRNHFLDSFRGIAALLVLAISILEVLKWVLREHSEAQAIQAAAVMQRGHVVDLDTPLAIAAAQLSHALRLPMADSTSSPPLKPTRLVSTPWTAIFRASLTWC